MKYLVLSILVGLITLNVFSFGLMNHTDGHMAGNCIISIVDGVACPQIGIATVLHYVNTYSIFSSAFMPFLSSMYLVLILLLFSVLVVLFKFFYQKIFFSIPSQYFKHKHQEPEIFFFKSKLLSSWLSLLENSPASA